MLIYVVDDEKNINEVECYALQSGSYDVQAFYTVKSFWDAMRERKPDLIVLDIMLPDGDGISVVQKLRKEQATQEIPVILVSAMNSEIEKVRGLDAGADDYLTKPFGVMELISRVKALLRRSKKTTDNKLIEVADIRLNEEKREVIKGDEIVSLTYKEFELLKYLMINRGIVLSRDRIMESVWGFDFQGESRTVDMHIKTLRQKIDKGTGIIKTVRNVGYKFL